MLIQSHAKHKKPHFISLYIENIVQALLSNYVKQLGSLQFQMFVYSAI